MAVKRLTTIWSAVVFVALLADAWLIAFYAPVELHQGPVQRIFYWHVPSAMAMMALFLLGGVLSFLYMVRKGARLDALAVASIEVGFLFCTICLVTGPLWAKPVWGAWWTWEPRLTATLFVWLVFLGYFLLRASIEDRVHARLYSAILAIFGCLDIPIILLAVKLWRGVHPQILSKRENLPDEMWATFIASAITVFLLASLLAYVRYGREARDG